MMRRIGVMMKRTRVMMKRTRVMMRRIRVTFEAAHRRKHVERDMPSE